MARGVFRDPLLSSLFPMLMDNDAGIPAEAELLLRSLATEVIELSFKRGQSMESGRSPFSTSTSTYWTSVRCGFTSFELKRV